MTENYGMYTYCTEKEISMMTLNELQKEIKTCENFIIYEEMADRGYRFGVVRELNNYYKTLKAYAKAKETMQ